MGDTIRICSEMLCLSYAGFFFNMSNSAKYICFVLKSLVCFHGNRMTSWYICYDFMVYFWYDFMTFLVNSQRMPKELFFHKKLFKTKYMETVLSLFSGKCILEIFHWHEIILLFTYQVQPGLFYKQLCHWLTD